MTSPDFAAAQNRIAARREARELSSHALLRAQRSHTEERLARLPTPIASVGRAGVGAWERIRGRTGTAPAFRVGQVDAELLDEELLSLLQAQVGSGLKLFGGHVQDDWAEEIMLALRAVLFKLSVWDHDATYGAALQNLRFTDARHRGPVQRPPSKPQKALYGLLTVFGSYTWTRLTSSLSTPSSPTPLQHRLSLLTTRLSTLHSVASLASFLLFLLHGRYRTLLDRLLRLRLAPPTSQLARDVSFEYLNRQLVWHAFTEFLLFLLPLVGIARWRRWLARAWRNTKSVLSTNPPSTDPSSTSAGPAKSGPLAHLPQRTCAICHHAQHAATSEAELLSGAAAAGGVEGSALTDVTNPYETPCGCVYCFVCLAGSLEAEGGDGWECLRCGEVVAECRPWGGDVVAEVPAPVTVRGALGGGGGNGNGKRVGFLDQEGRPMGEADGEEEEEGVSGSESEGDEEAELSGSDVYEEGEDTEELPDFDD